MTRPYNDQLACARRWQKSVDYGSPMAAWTPEMFKILDECNGDKVKAHEQYNKWKVAQVNLQPVSN